MTFFSFLNYWKQLNKKQHISNDNQIYAKIESLPPTHKQEKEELNSTVIIDLNSDEE